MINIFTNDCAFVRAVFVGKYNVAQSVDIGGYFGGKRNDRRKRRMTVEETAAVQRVIGKPSSPNCFSD